MSTTQPKFLKGHAFKGPEGMGYVLTRDVYEADALLEGDFKPYGRAPEPRTGDALPDWLIAEIWPVPRED